MQELLRPLEIGGVRLPNNLVLSPMAGFSDLPFRVLARRHGAGLVCTEMVSALGIQHGANSRRMKTVEEERPVSIQLFGTDPEAVATAAREAEHRCEILGFNMGCPAPQIKRQGCGAALLDRPELALELVETIKGASRKPLLVKIRAGNKAPMDVVAFATNLENAGADGLIFHARTAKQGYSGKSDWDLIRAVKQAVSIPVIGNGDVVDGPSAARALGISGADGIALGRGTLGDPHVFARVAAFLRDGTMLPAQSPADRLADLRAYVAMAREAGLAEMHVNAQAQQFTRGLPGAPLLRQSMVGVREPAALVALFSDFISGATRSTA
ncbi:MAG: tRNA dihydrouridine synthase [Methanobacteriota archaeon]